MIDGAKMLQYCMLLLLTIFTGAGSGRLRDEKTDDFYEGLHEKDITDSLRQMDDLDLALDTESPPRSSVRKDRHHHHHHHHKHHHRNQNIQNSDYYTELDSKSIPEFLSRFERKYYHKDKHRKQFDVTFINDQERWPRFEEIELLAGVSGWKKERWKIDKDQEVSTEKPKSSRTTKFTYRRVLGAINGSKRNAIIAVSAVTSNIHVRRKK